jgi:hypothetical protein
MPHPTASLISGSPPLPPAQAAGGAIGENKRDKIKTLITHFLAMAHNLQSLLCKLR